MKIIKSSWNNKDSFKLIPITEDCPYVEAIFDRDAKVLAVLSKIKKNTYQLVPKLDDAGEISYHKPTGKPKAERRLVETFHEYYITDSEDIKSFIKRFTTTEELEHFYAMIDAE